MIYFTGIVASYLVIGALVSYTAYKRKWNRRLGTWDQGTNFGWFIVWFWYGAMILSQNTSTWGFDFSQWLQDGTSALFDRLIAFEWRQNGKEDESSEGS